MSRSRKRLKQSYVGQLLSMCVRWPTERDRKDEYHLEPPHTGIIPQMLLEVETFHVET